MNSSLFPWQHNVLKSAACVQVAVILAVVLHATTVRPFTLAAAAICLLQFLGLLPLLGWRVTRRLRWFAVLLPAGMLSLSAPFIYWVDRQSYLPPVSATSASGFWQASPLDYLLLIGLVVAYTLILVSLNPRAMAMIVMPTDHNRRFFFLLSFLIWYLAFLPLPGALVSLFPLRATYALAQDLTADTLLVLGAAAGYLFLMCIAVAFPEQLFGQDSKPQASADEVAPHAS